MSNNAPEHQNFHRRPETLDTTQVEAAAALHSTQTTTQLSMKKITITTFLQKMHQLRTVRFSLEKLC